MRSSPSGCDGSRRVAAVFMGLAFARYLLLVGSAAGGNAPFPELVQAAAVGGASGISAAAPDNEPIPYLSTGHTSSGFVEAPVAWAGTVSLREEGARDPTMRRATTMPLGPRTPDLPSGFIPDHSTAPPLAD